MNKEQIEKHGEVMHWFIDNADKGVWRRDTPTNGWHIDTTPDWYDNFIYVQNDKYVEFRKALVDDKIVEYVYTENLIDKWFIADSNDFDSVYSQDRIYRIKPDKPKFKVGDWVVGLSRSSYIVRIKMIVGTSVFMEGEGSSFTHIDGLHTLVKHWEPKVGERVVLWQIAGEETWTVKCYSKGLEDIWDCIAPTVLLTKLIPDG